MQDAQILNLYTTHQRDLLSYASSIVGDDGRAEDIAQDAYMRFSTAMSDEWRSNPVGYLFRIVRNLALDCRRRAQFEKALFSHNVDDIVEAIPAEKSAPEQEVMARNELELLQEAMDELPERTRMAVEMHRLGGYKLREIAAHMNISVSMAQYLVKEGIKHCQRRLSSTASA
ncbi:RNA polymerase sigma factor [Microbulbifer taiwanensis]|uniref:RNA polymerase sigma factor n=1 Tax=Microbulbifer taiwanensis TaxID=986746 RepID=A0ABW1YIW9_9GAMM|nr:sigma-70 family RNA polymerase sigma factor [Microbulbifer taiwanensis]